MRAVDQLHGFDGVEIRLDDIGRRVQGERAGAGSAGEGKSGLCSGRVARKSATSGFVVASSPADCPRKSAASGWSARKSATSGTPSSPGMLDPCASHTNRSGRRFSSARICAQVSRLGGSLRLGSESSLPVRPPALAHRLHPAHLVAKGRDRDLGRSSHPRLERFATDPAADQSAEQREMAVGDLVAHPGALDRGLIEQEAMGVGVIFRGPAPDAEPVARVVGEGGVSQRAVEAEIAREVEERAFVHRQTAEAGPDGEEPAFEPARAETCEVLVSSSLSSSTGKPAGSPLASSVQT